MTLASFFPQIPWLCTAVAASLHYFFLASHCWMNVMSYDVYRTFAGNTCILTRGRTKSKFFPRYALYAWGVPLVVVGACLFIDLSHVMPSISIGQLNSVWCLFVCLFAFVVCCCCFFFVFYGTLLTVCKSVDTISVNKK
jgi:hypothetical protein